jgi:hypothetical protein
MVYDPEGQFVLLFGGLASWGATAYTWAGIGIPNSPTPGFFWLNLTGLLSLSPSPRYYASMTFDPSLHGVLLFGGQFSGGNDTLADTWLFTGNAGDPLWTLVHVAAHPSPRAGAALTFDPLDNYAVLFGGYDDPNFFSDTWTFAGGVWTELRTSSVPFERADAGFVFDNATGSCILTTGFGGAIDTWSFVHGIWTKLAPATPLGGRISPGVVYNYLANNLTFFGGESPSLSSAFGDTWNDSPTQVWSQLPTSGPSPRSAVAMAFDPFIGFTVLFGGGGVPTGFHNDTWLFGTWPLSTAPFSATLVANPAPALHPLIQPGENATVTVYPGGGIWPYHVAVSLLGPNGPHPPAYVISGSSNGSFTVSMRFSSPASYEILANVTAGGSGQRASVNLTYPVGSVVLPNWQPIRDAYQFHNFGSSWSPGGNCWGFSTTTILYWEHDIQGLVGTPELPSQAGATSALRIPPPLHNPGLNATTLAIIAHQSMDPANNVNDGGGFAPSQMAANYAKLLASLEAGEPSLLSLSAPGVGYHAVVAYGEFTDPLDGIVYILTTDPNDPLGTNTAVYNPTAETFYMVSDGIPISGFEVPTSSLPSTIQPNWVGPGNWGNSNWYENDSSFGFYYVLASVPVTVTSSEGGSDYFSDWSGAESQSFVQGIPNSAGIEEPHTYLVNGSSVPGSVQLFGIGVTQNTQYSIADPTAESYPIQVLLAINESGTPIVRGFDLNASSTGTHHLTLIPNPNGTTVRIGTEPVRMNVTFGQLVGTQVDSLNASALAFPGDSVVKFAVRNWSALGSSGHPTVLVRVTTDNGSGPSTQYSLQNNQSGLGPGASLDYAVHFDQTGLPPGKSWIVSVNGTVEPSMASTVSFELKNGSYPYLLIGPSGERVTGVASTGTIVVAGEPQTISLTFVKGATYRLLVAEKGLPHGARWCASVEAWERCSTGRSEPYLNLTPGTYSYALLSPTTGQQITIKLGRTVLGPSGSIVLSKSTTLALSFVYPYRVTFTESGLAGGSWSVRTHGRTITNASGDPIRFDLGNGTYGFKVISIAGYSFTTSPWKVVVDGLPTSVSVTFTATHRHLPIAPPAQGPPPELLAVRSRLES